MSPESSPASSRDAARRGALRRCRPAMGTFVQIAIHDAAPDAGAMRAAFGAIDRVAALMSFHDPASTLSRLNARAHGVAMRVDPWTRDVLDHARRLFDASGGLFDCTVGADLVARGLLPAHDEVPAAPGATFDDVVLLDDRRVAYRRPLRLDLGGIAKGYAVDRAIDALRAHGVASAVVNAGGDLRVLGDDPVPLRIRDLDHGRLIDAGTLADGACATSLAWRVRTGRAAQAPSAIVDPHRRRVVDHRRICSVIAPTCVVADGLTKVLAIAGSLDAALDAAVLQSFGALSLVH